MRACTRARTAFAEMCRTEPTSRTYVIAYPAGRELCSTYVDGDPERFRRLLTEQVRVRELLTAGSVGDHVGASRVRP